MKLTESRIKQIIKEEMELMEMNLDPTSIMMGAGAVAGLYSLYRLFFGEEASSEEQAVERIKQHVAELESQIKKSPFQPPPQSDYQKIAKQRLAKLKAKKAQKQG